jgi:phage shock protein A
MDLPQNAGSFYTRAANEILIDPFVSPPLMQNQLTSELAHCEDLVRRDFRYAHLVAGASKMPMNMIWVARNQGEDVSDRDLETLKDVAWNEFVKKRFLPSVTEGTPVSEAAASMLEIVRSMNLQRRRFQIMGLHEQVEASELQLVIHLCQAGLLHTSEYRITANRFRRHDKFFEAFALAVGAFVCASAPFTLGVATTQFNRSLQYEYKTQTIALFVFVLQQNRALVNQGVGLDEDYVGRIARLIIVSQDTGVVPALPECDCSKRKDSDDFIRSAIESVQRQADRVERLATQLDGGGRGGEKKVQEMISSRIREIRDENARTMEALKRENSEMRASVVAQIKTMQDKTREMVDTFETLKTSTVGLSHSFMEQLNASFTHHAGTLTDSAASGKSDIRELGLEMRNIILEEKAGLLEARKGIDTQFEALRRHLTEIRANADMAPAAAAGPVPQEQLNQLNNEVKRFIEEGWNLRLPTIGREIDERLKAITDQQLNTRIEAMLITIAPNLDALARSATVKLPQIDAQILSHDNALASQSAQQSSLRTDLDRIGHHIQHLPQYVTENEYTSIRTRVAALESKLAEVGERVEDMWNDKEEMPAADIRHPAPEIKQPAADITQIAEDVFNRHIRQPAVIADITNAVARDRELTARVDRLADMRVTTILAPLETRIDTLEQYIRVSGNTVEPGFSEVFTAVPLPPDALYAAGP